MRPLRLGAPRSVAGRFPEAAWLLVAADMPLLDPPLLATLVEHRDPTVLATAFRRADGTPEPLCAIWELTVREVIETAGNTEHVSLRRLLVEGPAKLIAADDEQRLSSVNTPADDERIRRYLEAQRKRFM